MVDQDHLHAERERDQQPYPAKKVDQEHFLAWVWWAQALGIEHTFTKTRKHKTYRKTERVCEETKHKSKDTLTLRLVWMHFSWVLWIPRSEVK